MLSKRWNRSRPPTLVLAVLRASSTTRNLQRARRIGEPFRGGITPPPLDWKSWLWIFLEAAISPRSSGVPPLTQPLLARGQVLGSLAGRPQRRSTPSSWFGPVGIWCLGRRCPPSHRLHQSCSFRSGRLAAQCHQRAATDLAMGTGPASGRKMMSRGGCDLRF